MLTRHGGAITLMVGNRRGNDEHDDDDDDGNWLKAEALFGRSSCLVPLWSAESQYRALCGCYLVYVD